MRVLALLWVVLCGIHSTNAASHSLKCLHTAVTVGTDFQKYTAVGFVDDEQIMYYDSNTRRMIPRTEWIQENMGEDYWDRESQRENSTQQFFNETIEIAMKRFHQTQGVHTLQRKYGCEWDDETGVTGWVNRFRYDGRDFVFMGMEDYRYKESMEEGFHIAKAWNHDKNKLTSEKQYLTQDCVEQLKKYVSYGRSALEWTVTPQVSLLQTNYSSPVTCHMTGFYPQGINVTWQKDGEALEVDVKLGETLPNGDRTFQISSHLWVKPEDWKSHNYTCAVQHKSLEQPIVLQVTESNIKSNRNLKNPESSGPPVGIIIGCVAGTLLLIITVIGVFIWKKRTSGSDTDSDGSNPPFVPGHDPANVSQPRVTDTDSDSSNPLAASDPHSATHQKSLVRDLYQTLGCCNCLLPEGNWPL